MKAGTTTLYRDLLSNPDVFFAADKEVGCLAYDEVLSQSGQRHYAAAFKTAGAATAVGDASTDYAKLPDKHGVAGRALKVLGPELKVVYMIRDPVQRLLSQHHFEYQRGWVGPDVEQAIVEEPRFLAYSRYGMQIAPWYETFGEDQIQIIQFEDYIIERAATVAETSRFLGVTPRPDLIDVTTNYNPTVGVPTIRGAWASLSKNRLYRQTVRRLLSVERRRQFRLRLVPTNDLPAPKPPTVATISYLRELLEEDLRRFHDLTGKTVPFVEWCPPSDGVEQ